VNITDLFPDPRLERELAKRVRGERKKQQAIAQRIAHRRHQALQAASAKKEALIKQQSRDIASVIKSDAKKRAAPWEGIGNHD